MRKRFYVAKAISGFGIFALTVFCISAVSAAAPSCNTANMNCIATRINTASSVIKSLQVQTIATPALPSTPVGRAPSGGGRVVQYTIETRGTITTSLGEFKIQVNQTLNDARGWSRLGVSFQEVATGGTLTVVLAEANQVAAASSGCDSTYSCTVGRYVLINQDRWLGATPSWNNAGGSLRDYRHMVVNHETGHWLGRGHSYCSGAGQLAPVMQQQSINLQGCNFNPWPLNNELSSTRLGI